MMNNNKARISGEEVLTKLKDDGDFDKLRLKIIRELKDDAELRDNIISMVKQSVVLNRPGAETMKPRQLSDAIHEEIGNKVMSRISDGVWKIIRSGSEMKAEIIETVQSVYNKLLDPKVNEDDEPPMRSDLSLPRKRPDANGSAAVSASEIDVREPEGEPNEPPGFSLHGQGWNNKSSYENHQPGKRLRMSRPCDGKARVEPIKETTSSPDRLEPQSVCNNVQPRLHEAIEQQLDDGTDDDPDVPPGFG